MREEEKFDDILKSKIEGAEFGFNPDNWDKAEAMIIAADKKRKRRRFAFIFFIGLTLGISVMIPFIHNEKKNLITEKENKSIKSNNYTKKSYKQEDVKNENNILLKSSQSLLPEKEVKKSITPANTNNIKNTLSQRKLQPNQEKSKKYIINSKASKLNSNDDMVSSGKRNYTNMLKNKKKSKVNDIESIKEGNAITNKDEDNVIIHKDIASFVNDKNMAVKADSNMINHAVSTDLLKDTTIVEDTLKKAVKDSLNPIKKDSMGTIAENNSSQQKFVFEVDAGINYSLGWKNNTVKEGAGFNRFFGINLIHFFAKKWAVEIGAQYNNFAHLNYSHYTSSNIQYAFGYNQSKIIITPTTLQYLTVPVKIEYWANLKNSLIIGINTLYLLNTNSKIETDTYSDFATPTAIFSKKSGYRDGFSTFDLQPTIGYRRKIYKGFHIYVEAYYGLTDIKKNAFFGINKTEHNSGFKLALSYWFNKK